MERLPRRSRRAPPAQDFCCNCTELRYTVSMSANRPLPLFRADRPAESAGMVARDPRCVSAVKLECRVTVDTPEGPVRAAAGDAIVTDRRGDWLVEGSEGSLYVVSAAAFAR